jgi:hypothetical protein
LRNSIFIILILFEIQLSLGCGSSSDATSNALAAISLPNGFSLPIIAGSNVITLTVDGSECSGSTLYINKPCVAVTLCDPSGGNCETIHDILLDTGSYGLRVFKSVITAMTGGNALIAALTTIAPSAGHALAECVYFGDGSTLWGPVVTGTIVLGGESATSALPIQLIDSSYASVTNSTCPNPDSSPSVAYFNGILGIGLFNEDCGSNCVNFSNNNNYFSCIGSSCAGTTVSLSNQVQNPIPKLSQDNNGAIVMLPSIPMGGVVSSNGYLILGIDTQSNNKPGSVTTLVPSSSTGYFRTQYDGSTYSSFLDTGSNGLYFPSTLSACRSPYSAFYCPASAVQLQANNLGISGTPSTLITFNIGNLLQLDGNNAVFSEVGGTLGGSLFDWGLPFYLGRNVYHGMVGASSSLGTGPYWAY